VERRQAHSSLVSRVRGATIRVSDTRAVPLQPGRPLGAPRGDFRPRTHAVVSGSGTPEPSATARQAVNALAVGVRTSHGAVRAVAAGRHTWLRLQVVSGDVPS
jgi:hypothetical protein